MYNLNHVQVKIVHLINSVFIMKLDVKKSKIDSNVTIIMHVIWRQVNTIIGTNSLIVLNIIFLATILCIYVLSFLHKVEVVWESTQKMWHHTFFAEMHVLGSKVCMLSRYLKRNVSIFTGCNIKILLKIGLQNQTSLLGKGFHLGTFWNEIFSNVKSKIIPFRSFCMVKRIKRYG